MSERDDADFYLLLMLIIFVGMIFTVRGCSSDGQLRDLQRRMGQLEERIKQ